MGITIENLRVDDLHANPHNPRKQVGDVDELASSIRSQGIKQPLLVTPTGERDIDGHAQYRVVIGHRRLAAARQAGLATVPAIVEEMDARREQEIMLVENTQRSDLTPVEEADGYQGLLDLGMHVKEMAEKTGRSDRFVRKRLRIARIPQETRDMASDFSQLTLDQLDKLAEFESDPDMQRELARSKDFEWTYRKLSKERDGAKWVEEADKALSRAGIKVESFSGDKQYWNWTPRGYRYEQTIHPGDDAFWKRFTGLEAWPELRVFFQDESFTLYRPIPPEQLEKAEREKAGQREAKARRGELDRQAREFESIAKANRIAWLKTNLHTLTHERTVAGICELVRVETVGRGSQIPYQPSHGEGVVATLVGFGWSLPITEHGGDHWSLECEENLDAIRRTLDDRPMRILDVLAARQEEHADWHSWRDERGVKNARAWYDALEHLGYKPSAEEREALKGAYLDKGDDES